MFGLYSVGPRKALFLERRDGVLLLFLSAVFNTMPGTLKAFGNVWIEQWGNRSSFNGSWVFIFRLDFSFRFQIHVFKCLDIFTWLIQTYFKVDMFLIDFTISNPNVIPSSFLHFNKWPHYSSTYIIWKSKSQSTYLLVYHTQHITKFSWFVFTNL